MMAGKATSGLEALSLHPFHLPLPPALSLLCREASWDPDAEQDSELLPRQGEHSEVIHSLLHGNFMC